MRKLTSTAGLTTTSGSTLVKRITGDAMWYLKNKQTRTSAHYTITPLHHHTITPRTNTVVTVDVPSSSSVHAGCTCVSHSWCPYTQQFCARSRSLGFPFLSPGRFDIFSIILALSLALGCGNVHGRTACYCVVEAAWLHQV